MNPLGWNRNDGKDDGLYWPRSAMDAAWKVYWADPRKSASFLAGQEILRLLRDE